MRSPRLALAAVLLTITAAGCGGSTPDAATPSPSTAQAAPAAPSPTQFQPTCDDYVQSFYLTAGDPAKKIDPNDWIGQEYSNIVAADGGAISAGMSEAVKFQIGLRMQTLKLDLLQSCDSPSTRYMPAKQALSVLYHSDTKKYAPPKA